MRYAAVIVQAIRSALAKLESLLPEMARQPAVITKDNIRWDVPDRNPTVLQVGHLRTLAEAIQVSRCIHIRYRTENSTTERTVAPYGVVYSDGAWYLVGYCHLRDALRMFRVDRIMRAQMEELTFERPEDFDLGAFTERQWAQSLEARLRQVAPSVTLRVPPWVLEELDRHWLYRYARREVLRDGDALVTIHDDDPVAVVRMVRQWGPQVEVTAPQEVRDQLRAEGAALMRQYEGEPSVKA